MVSQGMSAMNFVLGSFKPSVVDRMNLSKAFPDVDDIVVVHYLASVSQLFPVGIDREDVFCLQRQVAPNQLKKWGIARFLTFSTQY